MTTAKIDQTTGQRIVRVSRATVAAAQARLSLASKLGLPVSNKVKAIAALGSQTRSRS